MAASIPDSIRLFGTLQPVSPPRKLTAGPLTAELDAGNLRYIRFHGREMMRAVSFIVRDKNWGTYNPVISNEIIEETDDSFRVSYDAVAKDATQEFRYSARIVGKADGSLTFAAKGTAQTDFLTNRTGFVVLHPIHGVAGAPCTVQHVDGRVEKTSFPALIDPVQPMKELRALTHEFIPGLKVTCRMEGDTYEMEDQRNWTDASYKTYVRPLALPWPYVIPKGEGADQSVTLTVSGTATASVETAEGPVTVALGEEGAAMPALGLGLDPADASAVIDHAGILKAAGPKHIVCSYDPLRGHEEKVLEQMARAAQALGAEAWLEFVIPTVDRFEEDIDKAGRAAADLGSPFATVMVSPAPDLKSTLPGSPWPPCPPLDACYRAARKAFPKARLGGGMFSFFTELNRKRPPVALLDFVTFSTTPLVHAGDDRSATESLESLPHVIESVQAFINGKPYHVGPTAIGMRMNPYGAAPMENPLNIRQAMNRMDPRQRGMFGAAWYLGYVAHFARGRASAITLGAGVGEFGLLYTKRDYPQPWFDENGGVYPVFHVFKGLAALSGRRMVETRVSRLREVQALAAAHNGDLEIWIANLTGEEKLIDFDRALAGTVSILEATSFETAATDREAIRLIERPFTERKVLLGPYAVARLCAKQ
jgi:D-apionolactonase